MSPAGLLRALLPTSRAADRAKYLVRRADAARDGGRFAEAATLYGEALELRPNHAGILVQRGNMLKENEDFGGAEQAYRAAALLRPADADIALQLGHLHKRAGRLPEAEASYEQAIALDPVAPRYREALESLYRWGWRPLDKDMAALDALDEIDAMPAPVPGAPDPDADPLERAPGLIPQLAPRDPRSYLHGHGERIDIRRLGRRERSHWGMAPTLRGIEALRGFCISATPIVEVQVLLNGQLVHRQAVAGGYPLRYENQNVDMRKYVFNIWFDFAPFARGRVGLEFRLIDARRDRRTHHEHVVIADPLDEADHPKSDGLISLPPGEGSLERRINARPSMMRPGPRAMLDRPPRSVLIQRTDQLGDIVVSVPAMRRLREILPEARLVGLLSTANVELARTLGLFDEIIAIDFPDDPWERRRVMPLAAQAALREQLHAYDFDMAIDLSESVSSRLLLLLSGAPFTFGFPAHEAPFLDVEVAGFTHDRMDGHEVVPHTNKLMGMIEWLGAMLGRHSQVVRRDDLPRDRLAAFGLTEGARFALLHDGARLEFTRWVHYPALAELILAQTDLIVVMLSDDPGTRAALPPALAGSDRFILLDRKLAFDDFDALMHHCAVFVGNDSGPKHLASLRGAPVVSIHMARNNWNEWGQENSGTIVSRKVPCAGCLIWYDPEECGKDFACLRLITPAEIFAAVRELI